MIKKFESFFSKKKVNPLYQDKLDAKLDEAILRQDYYAFIDIIKKGANINKYTKNSGYPNSFYSEGKYYTTPLIDCIMRDLIKFIKYLIDCEVDLFDQPMDIYDYINKILEPKYRKEVIDYIIKKHPDFMEERERRNDVKKYNL